MCVYIATASTATPLGSSYVSYSGISPGVSVYIAASTATRVLLILGGTTYQRSTAHGELIDPGAHHLNIMADAKPAVCAHWISTLPPPPPSLRLAPHFHHFAKSLPAPPTGLEFGVRVRGRVRVRVRVSEGVPTRLLRWCSPVSPFRTPTHPTLWTEQEALEARARRLPLQAVLDPRPLAVRMFALREEEEAEGREGATN